MMLVIRKATTVRKIISGKQAIAKLHCVRLVLGSFLIAILFSTAAHSLPKFGPKIDAVEIDSDVKIKVSEKEEIDPKQYLINCGQRCAFQTASEVMAATQVYFRHYKESTKKSMSKSRQDKVRKCMAGDKQACDSNDVLDSMMHYMVGLEIRDGFLRTASALNNMNSKIGDYEWQSASEGSDDPNSTGETRYEKWFSGKGTWEVMDKDKLPIFPTEDRDNFRFNLADFEDIESEKDKLEELDPDFVKDYQAFFNNFRRPEDRFFARARKADTNIRTLATEDGDTESNDANASSRFVADFVGGKNEAGETILVPADFEKDLAAEVASGFERVRGQAQAFLKTARKARNPQGILQVGNGKRPAIFRNDLDKTAIDQNRDFIKQIEFEAAKTGTDLNTPIKDIPGKAGETIRESLALNPSIKPETIANGTLTNVISELQASITQGTTAPAGAQAIQQAAYDNVKRINDHVTQFIQGTEKLNKGRTEDTRTVRAYAIDIPAFDKFLDQIWPTEARGTL